MFGLSFFELIVIFFIALIVLGPDKLQEFAKKLGNFISSINDFSSNIKDSFSDSLTPSINTDKNTNDFKKIEEKDDKTDIPKDEKKDC